VDFTLTPLTFYTISGRVTDPTGQPIEDAWARVSRGQDPYYDSDWTDADGWYQLHVPAGTYHVFASKHGYTWPDVQIVSVPPDQADVDFVLSPTDLEIRGTVRDTSGRVLPTAYVYTFMTGQTSSLATNVYYDGTYARGMVSGTHRAYANADCYVRSERQEVTLPPSHTGLDFSLAPEDQLISGSVRDTNGALICDARVSATLAGNSASSDTGYTERNGRYALQVPSGSYTLRAYKAGYGPAPDQTVTVPPYARGTDLILRAPGNTIQGTVRDNKGTAIAGATVRASTAEGSVSVPSGADGRYAIQVFDGAWAVSASKAGYATFTAPHSLSVPPDQSGIDFVLVSEGDLRRTYLPLILNSN
jgi:protocatechuate 3,4-dioxygenase beta subunit